MHGRLRICRYPLVWATILALTSACSDTINPPVDPADKSDPADPPGSPDQINFNATLDGTLAVNGAAVGTGNFTVSVDMATGEITGTVTLIDFVADSVELREGFVGETGELVAELALEESNFVVPDNTFLTNSQLALVTTGGLNILATAPGSGEALRGQLAVAGQQFFFTQLDGTQQIPQNNSAQTATAGLTFDEVSSEVIVRLQPSDTETTIASAAIMLGSAGIDNDTTVLQLEPDANSPGQFIEPPGASLSADQLDALTNAELYFETTNSENSAGDARGQLLPQGVELTLTSLAGDQVVPPVTTQASGSIATTAFDEGTRITIVVNLTDLDDASDVTLRQAVLGQNGPALFVLTQNPNNLNQWSLIDQTLSAEQANLLATQQLFISVNSSAFPNGELRGQITPASSNLPPAENILQVIDLEPAAGEVVSQLPTSIVATFNNFIDSASVVSDSVQFSASGGDGSFGEANDVVINPTDITVSEQSITLDLSGIAFNPDTFQLLLSGMGTSAILGDDGAPLDGDADNVAGGDFISTFTVAQAPNVSPTFTEVQEIFTASCLPCHSNLSLSGGLGLQAPQTFSNIVNVPSSQVPSLSRIEPNDPEESYIIDKLEGTQAVGGQMPLGQSPLPVQTIQLIRDWITAGAPDN